MGEEWSEQDGSVIWATDDLVTPSSLFLHDLYDHGGKFHDT